MDAYEFCSTASDFLSNYNMYAHFSGKPLSRKAKKRKDLLEDIVSTKKCVRLSNSISGFYEPISPIKLKGNYSRKLVVQVFSALGAKVTRYTREYGRTIVHFEDASDSAK